MRQLAELLSDRGVASLRYDKVGTGKTGLGPIAPADRCRQRRLHRRVPPQRFGSSPISPAPTRPASRCTALGEGAIHAMSLATDTAPGAPKIHSLGLFQPLSGRYLDIITNRVRADASPATLTTWLAAVDEVRTKGTVPAKLPEGLGAIVNPGNVEGRRGGRQDRPGGAGRRKCPRAPRCC